jgi:hypothetical protein
MILKNRISTVGEKTNQEIQRLEALAKLFDTRFSIFGLKFGLDPLVGLIPGLGNALPAAVSIYILSVAFRLKAPKSLLFRMVGNIAIDLILGSVPIVGDVFDVIYKANLRNVELLKKGLIKQN